MAKVILICGKLCSGKSFYCRQLLARQPAVLLSCDELDSFIFHHALGAKHDAVMADVQRYLREKACDVVRAGCDAILDWGFWGREARAEITQFFITRGIAHEWHYIDVTDADWQDNIAKRNRAVASGETTDYPMDAGLLCKLGKLFEVPAREEMDVWYRREHS